MGLITGLTDSPAPRLPRLSDVLFPLSKQSFDSFAILPSNAQAVEVTRRFATRGTYFVSIVGPSGCGKSHLLESVAHRLSGTNPVGPEVQDATTWSITSSNPSSELPLILDNVQDALDRSRVRLQLRLSLERRVRANRPTLLSFTAQKPNRSIKSFLPFWKEWIVCGIPSPDEQERELLIREMMKAEGLRLSAHLIWLLSHRMGGNGCSLLGALKRLRLHHSDWLDPNMTLRACGMLNMFFSDSSSWDLRDQIAHCAEDFESQFELGPRRDLALFTMLRVAMLAESEVAQYFSMEPAKAYTSAIRFEEKISLPAQAEARNEVLRFINYTILSLRHA